MTPTPIRGLRVPDDEWASWQRQAEKDGISVTEFIRRRVNHPLDAGLTAAGRVKEVRIDIEDDEEITAPATTVAMSGAPPRPLPAPTPVACKHPKSARDPKGYATICSKAKGGCGARL